MMILNTNNIKSGNELIHLQLKQGEKQLGEKKSKPELIIQRRTRNHYLLNKKLLKANKELKKLENSKTEFLNIISHELRTPLNGILGFIDLFKDISKNSVALDLLELLNQSCKRLEDFSFKALDISMLNSKGFDSLVLEKINTEDVIQHVIYTHRKEILKKKLRVRATLESNLVNADVNYINKCIGIMVTNAITHSPLKGEIIVKSKKSGEDFIISVKDQGTGFPKRIIQSGIKAFSSKHIDENPGLDLYLCKLIAEAHLGAVVLNNNCGAIITIKIPLKPKKNRAANQHLN